MENTQMTLKAEISNPGLSPLVCTQQICRSPPAPPVSAVNLAAMVRRGYVRGFLPRSQSKDGIELSLCFGVECSVLDASLLLLLSVASQMLQSLILMGSHFLRSSLLALMGLTCLFSHLSPWESSPSTAWEGAELQPWGGVEEEDAMQQA